MTASPKRIQLSRQKGWRKPDGAIVVGRPTQWGNPFIVGDSIAVSTRDGDAWVEATVTPEVAVALFRSWLAEDEQEDFVHRIRAELKDHDLACWCDLDQPCHADVLLDLANR